MRDRLRKALRICVCLYLAALAGLYVFQRDFIYLPGLAQNAAALQTAQADPRFESFEAKTAGGLILKGLWARAEGKFVTIAFFHGNADNVRTMAPVLSPLVNAGYGVLLVEYRGYNGQGGKPDEKGLYEDSRAFIEALKARGVEEKTIVLYGHSLGTGVATQMALEYPGIAALALAAPYLSVAKMAQHRFPIFPSELLTLDRFDNLAKIGQIKAPLLIGHGDKDIVIPISHGQRLFAAAREPKTFRLFPGKGHTEILEDMNRAMMEWLK